eukprot:COSAG02_NODE_6671_length_3427_cov_2.969050_1_plen_161_part_00
MPTTLTHQQITRGHEGPSVSSVAFMREERDHLEQRMNEYKVGIERMRTEATESRMQALQAEAKLQVATAKAEAKLQAEALKYKHSLCNEHQRQLPALQARLEALHAAKLLQDEELYVIEDAIADSEDMEEGGCVSKLIALSAKIPSDRAFARQLQRRKWS